MQPVLGLVPHDRLRAVDHLGGDFLAAMRRQAMHEQRVLLRRAHHLGVDLPGLEIAPALLVFRLEAHRGPDVGGDQVGAPNCFHGVGESLAVFGGSFRFDFIPGRRRDVQLEIEQRRGLQPGIADVVGVADPGHRRAADWPAVVDVGVNVGQDLAGVVLVGEPVDHRHARVPREALEDVLLEGADHDYVAHARYDLRGVLHRLAAPELRIARAEEDRGAAELVHPGLERKARARRLLLEDHRQRAVFDQCAAALGSAPRARKLCTSGASRSTTMRPSAGVMTSGGSMRMTLSAVTLITSPASSACLTSSPHGWPSSMPIIRPMPRISVMPWTSESPLRMTAPTFSAFASRPSSLIASMVVTTAVMASGLPPKVEPWLPGLNTPLARPPTTQAPTGTPEPRPFASGTTSGRKPACW